MESDEEEPNLTAGHFHLGNMNLFPLDRYRITDPCAKRRCLVKAMCRKYCEEKMKNVNFRRYLHNKLHHNLFARFYKNYIKEDSIVLTFLHILLALCCVAAFSCCLIALIGAIIIMVR